MLQDHTGCRADVIALRSRIAELEAKLAAAEANDKKMCETLSEEADKVSELEAQLETNRENMAARCVERDAEKARADAAEARVKLLSKHIARRDDACFRCTEIALKLESANADRARMAEVLSRYATLCGGAEGLDQPFRHKPRMGYSESYSECLGCHAKQALSPASAALAEELRAMRKVCRAIDALTDPEDKLDSAVNPGPERDELQRAYDALQRAHAARREASE
jgi:uncharacterized coiled-coil protein SlyX